MMKVDSRKSPEEKLLNALALDQLTEGEARYLKWLINRPLMMEHMRELFKAKFPDSKWIIK